jgi:hypothetical protein
MVVLLALQRYEQPQYLGHRGKLEGVCCLVTVVQIGIAKLAVRQLLDFEGQHPASRPYIM